MLAGCGYENGGRALAEAKTRRGLDNNVARRMRLLHQRLCTTRDAGNVVAHVHNNRRARLEREHSIKRRYAVHFGWRDIQALSYIVHSSFADPTGAGLYR